MGSRILAGRYELLEKIGEGGMAVVFKAKDRTLDRFVAIKILRPEYTQDESFIDSFLRESQLVAGIVDPNIVQVYDVGQEGNIHYIVMELVEGETLSEIIKREGKLDSHTVVSYGRQIASALKTAHANRLIHRDIKPHNIMITKDGVAKLTDFGIAKRVNPEQNMSGDEKEAVMGSIHYFSPEQARGIPVDERTDIYSLGIVMYEMVTGRVPFDGDNAVDVAIKHMNEPMIPPSKFAFDMPQDLEDIIMKATDKSVDKRFHSADEMIMALSFVKYSKLVKYDPPVYAGDDDDASLPAGRQVKEKEPEKFWQRRLAFTAAFIIAMIPIVWSILDFAIDTIKAAGRTVTVPSLFEMSFDEAKTKLESEGLVISLDSEIVNDNYEEGTVLSQSPSAEAVVRPGATIKVNVSRKSPMTNVPEVRNMDVAEAKAKIQSYGLTTGSVTEVYSDTVTIGKVISTSPVAGTSLKRGESVNMVVSKGSDGSRSKEKFTVNTVGMTLNDAISLLSSKGCYYTVEYREDYNSGIERGCVLSQSPLPSEEVTEGTQFTLIVRTTIEEGQSQVTLNIDLSGLEEGEHYIAIIVTDDYENSKGVTQWPRSLINKTDNMTSAEYVIHGRGVGSAVVVIDNTTISYTVDFNNGTASVND